VSNTEIPGASPWFGESLDDILGDVREILESGQLVNGKHIVDFEARTAAMANTPYAAGVNSGGTALELALLALGVEGKEVIVPTQTFIASANAVTRAGGRPVFADVEKDTLCLDPADVERRIGPTTCGVMIVHMFGLVPPSVLEIKNLCARHGLFLIEDAAHAHGASRDGLMAGGIGDAGCFSFFATKVVTTGEGGAVTTSQKELHDRVLSLRNHGRNAGSEEYGLPGNNFRLSEIQAALGWRQLALLERILDHRNLLAKIYRDGLAGHSLIATLPEFPGGRHAYWRFPAYLADHVDRRGFQRGMWERHRIRITWMYEPLCHRQPVSRTGSGKSPPSLPVAEQCIDRLVCLPTHMAVSPDDAQRVVAAIKNELGRTAN